MYIPPTNYLTLTLPRGQLDNIGWMNHFIKIFFLLQVTNIEVGIQKENLFFLIKKSGGVATNLQREREWSEGGEDVWSKMNKFNAYFK